jgi:hypothetical protein
MLHHLPLPGDGLRTGGWFLWLLLQLPPCRSDSAFAVLELLLLLVLTVELDTASGGLLLAVGLAAAKGTPQVLASDITLILAPGIARIGEEENAAMPASLQASSQVRVGSENRPQEEVIRQDKSPDLGPSIPSSLKLKMLRDPYCKKPKLWLRIPTSNWMSSSYLSRYVGVEAVGRGLLLARWKFPRALTPRPLSLERRRCVACSQPLDQFS